MQLSRALLSDGASARAAPRFRFERLRHRTAEGVCLRQGSSSCVPPRRPSPPSLLYRWRAAATTTRCDQRSAPERSAQEQYLVSTTWGGLSPKETPTTPYLVSVRERGTKRSAASNTTRNLRVCRPLSYLPQHARLRCYPIAGPPAELGVS